MGSQLILTASAQKFKLHLLTCVGEWEEKTAVKRLQAMFEISVWRREETKRLQIEAVPMFQKQCEVYKEELNEDVKDVLLPVLRS